MNRRFASPLAALVLGLLSPGCGSPATTTDPTPTDPNTCQLVANTTALATVNAAGCHVLGRDTSSCQAARQAQGLSGVWLKFSCRVALSATAQLVTATADGQPDYKSNYFPTTNACHETYTGAMQNPNLLSAQHYSVAFPLSPNTVSQSMRGIAVVGLAVNGVPINANFAAPGDDIYLEAKSFDRCGGHPQNTGSYHYHSEPYAISDDDANLVGVMRDGYALYGRKDADGSYPTLDANGGHSGVTADSPTAVYHYHVNQQTSTAATSMGQMQWFLTTGTFKGTPAACTTCN